MGRRLSATLNRRIREVAGDDRSRAEIIEAMGQAAGIDAGTVNQILQGDIDCPPPARLRGLARALDISANTLTTAADEDGCGDQG